MTNHALLDPPAHSAPGATTQRRSADIVGLPLPIRVTLTHPIAGWTDAVRARLNHLCQLQYGWDGYRGRPTRFDVAHFAFELLRRVCRPTTPAPSIVPLPSGGLQIEWHMENADIELIVRAPFNVEVWVSDPVQNDDGIEQLLSTDYAFIVPWVKKLG